MLMNIGLSFAMRIKVVANIILVWIICTTKQPLLFPQIYLYIKKIGSIAY